MSADDNAIRAAAVTARRGAGPGPGDATVAAVGIDRGDTPRAALVGGPSGATGLMLGVVAVVAFSFSFPTTKLALEGFDPWLVAFGRAAVAGLLAAAYLAATRAPLPTREQRGRLLIVAGGVVVGFPLCTSLALVSTDAAHGAIVIAVLPAATALAAVARAGERPRPAFWLAAGAGLAIVVAFVLQQASGALTAADAFLLAGTACCAIGYAEGGALARELSGPQTISWALVLSMPLTISVTVVVAATTPPDADLVAWAGFGWQAAVAMYLGFFAWYAGLARGGVARIGQVQLLQPLLTVLVSAALLGERLTPVALVAGVGVLACVAATQRARVAVRPRRTRPVACREPARART